MHAVDYCVNYSSGVIVIVEPLTILVAMELVCIPGLLVQYEVFDVYVNVGSELLNYLFEIRRLELSIFQRLC